MEALWKPGWFCASHSLQKVWGWWKYLRLGARLLSSDLGWLGSLRSKNISLSVQPALPVLRFSMKTKVNSLMEKCFEKHKFWIYARLVLPLMITSEHLMGCLWVRLGCLFIYGPLGMRLGPQLVWIYWCCCGSRVPGTAFLVRAYPFSLYLTKPTSPVCLRSNLSYPYYC